MTALEVFAILVLAGAVIVLIYYYMKEFNRTGNSGFDTWKSSVTQAGKGVSDAGNRIGEELHNPSFDSIKSGATDMGKKVSTATDNVYSGISKQNNDNNDDMENKKPGFGERVSGMGESLKGRVKEVPISTDAFSGRIDEFLHERSDQLIKDWELATKSDLGELEKKYSKVSRDIEDLDKRFNEYREHANKKFESIEDRLDALEVEEQQETSK